MKLTSLIEGIGLGAVAMFLLDPERGGRRRAMLRDQVAHQAAKKRKAVQIMTHDFANRAKGLGYKVQGQMHRDDASDDTLVERARAEIGHVVSHSSSIHISCENGILTLSGPIIVAEMDACLRAMQKIPGVREVRNDLETHVTGEHVSGLQGGKPRPVLGRWTPSTCFVMSVTGALCVLYGRSRKGVMGGVFRVGGMGLITKAFHDTEQRFDSSHSSHSVGGDGSGSRETKALPRMDGAEPVTEKGHAGMV